MTNNKSILLLLLAAFTYIQLSAQRHEIYSEQIKTLQVTPAHGLPIITLGTNDAFSISFDDLTHEYHRYTYKVEHCEADWTLSEELFASDFVDGFSEGRPIDDLEESLNTNVLYTHYQVEIPNSQCRLKMSGNYKVTICDEDNDSQPVLTVCFMVVEPLMGIQMSVTTNTDIDINNAHQQVEMQLNYGNVNVTDPERQITTIVMQNSRWDNARWNPKPQFTTSDGLKWTHCRDLIFSGGNEYHKFEMLDVTHTTMGLEAIDWDGDDYHAYVWTDEPRRNYVYDEDANGAFIIRNMDNEECDRTCEYLITHFRMKSPRYDGRVYLNAQWTYDQFLPQYEMIYNDEEEAYECAIPLKQGYYSYQYLLMNADGSFSPVPTEGNFYQTENQYEVLVYFKGNGERTDRLVGYGRIKK